MASAMMINTLYRELEATSNFVNNAVDKAAPAAAAPAASINSVDPDAGEILYVLATNFLLYAALVLITYLVVKLYVESSPDNPLFDTEVSYGRLPTTASGIDFLR
jgi:hypothetical protein